MGGREGGLPHEPKICSRVSHSGGGMGGYPLKHETLFHKMIPRKSTINNNLESS